MITILISKNNNYETIYNLYFNGYEIGYISKSIHRDYYILYKKTSNNHYAYVTSANCIMECKEKMIKHIREYGFFKDTNQSKDIPFHLTSKEEQFYPTPSKMVGLMYSFIDWNTVDTILEPSAGSGNLIENIPSIKKSKTRHSNNCDIDCIEINENLRYILKGKGHRVVFDDFTKFHSDKHYDLIIANPPFANGDSHLLKAINIQEVYGGQICFLLNAKTLKNPYSNTRKELMRKLNIYNAKIKYVTNGFSNAMRKTDVEIAIIYLNIPAPKTYHSNIYDGLKRASEIENNEFIPNELAITDYIADLITKYNLEVKYTIAVSRELDNLNRYALNSISVINLSSNNSDFSINKALKHIRYKYWHYLFKQTKFTSHLTNNLQEHYFNIVNEMENYEFNMFNIKQVLVEMNSQLKEALNDTIMSLFNKMTAEHTYYEACQNNIHYYNGWKSNKAHKIGKKVIIPFNAYNYWGDCLSEYECLNFLKDIEKVLDYINPNSEDYTSIEHILKTANKLNKTRNINFKYFMCSFYKKGTVHITFTNQLVIDMLNIYAGRKNGWLPPSYGKKAYTNLSNEEKNVIDSFQSREEYETVCTENGKYLYEIHNTVVPLLTENIC